MDYSEINRLRNKVVTSIMMTVLTAMFVPLLGVFFGGVYAVIAIMLVVIVGAIFINQELKSYKSVYKELISTLVLKELFEVEEYNPNSGFSKEQVKATYFIPHGNTYSSDDYVRGYYQGCKFERSDVCMQDVTTDSEGNTTTTTLFMGSWTIVEFPKNISHYMLIRERKLFRGGKPGGFWSSAPQTKLVKFEDINFNNRFEVYAQDEQEAFYIINPIFMEAITKLLTQSKGRLLVGFIDKQIHVLFDTRKNAMEPPIFREVNDEDIGMIKEEMAIVGRLIEVLRLQKDSEV